ncbi:energy transducer TonB [Parerythrobacter aestuarii]|uniref:energy transducer TonB n=1 Tax=Parerythrobacter aestuarii TaxID=3020909 RepID=UPI0024DEC2E7|nr:energy transducer TonB [Parerythrobacter aestuarii]
MITLRAALAGLALTIGAAAPALAQEDAPGPDGWTIREFTGGCSARFRIDGEHPATLVKTRTYRGGSTPSLSLEFELPALVGREQVWNLTLSMEGEPEPIGSGNARNLDDGTAKALITLTGGAQAQLAGGWSAERILTLEQPGAATLTWNIEGPPSQSITFDDCYARAGELLMAARPEGEAPGSGARGPVPRTSPGRWISTNDYPSRALREGAQGTTRYQATIDRFGYVTHCLIIASAGNVHLDAATCRAIERRARFYPARDEQDQAIEATIAQDVVWELP